MDKKNYSQSLTRRGPSTAVWFASTVIVLSLIFFTMKAEGAVFNVEPSLLTSVERNDNIFLQENNRTPVNIYRVLPMLHLKYAASAWDSDLNLSYDYRHYGNDNIPDGSNYILNFKNRAEAIKNVLFIEVIDVHDKVSNNIAINYAEQNPFVNQVEQNVFIVHPYANLKVSPTTTITLGYTYTDVEYRNGAGINRLNKVEYAEMTTSLSSRLSFTTGVQYMQESNRVLSYDQVYAYTGPSYAYAENCYAFVRIGKSQFDLGPQEEKIRHSFWDAGIRHRVSSIAVDLDTRRFLVLDPLHVTTMEDLYMATITKSSARSLLTLSESYGEFRDILTNQLTLRNKQTAATLSYRLSPMITSTLGSSVQNVGDKILSGETRILSSYLRFDRQLMEKMTIAFEYRYLHSHSSEIAIDNYTNNQFLIEFKKAFY